jgi:ribose transport system ATP-binding protein
MSAKDQPGGRAGASISPVLCLRRVSKVFPGQVALAEVDLALLPGRMHGLVGQNGSGKSTLIKIMAGYHVPEGGAEGRLGDLPFRFGSPGFSHAAGLRFIHQDLGLVDELSVIDNLALGVGYHSRWWISLRRAERLARRTLTDIGIDVDVRKPVGGLTAVEKTMVAVARALDGSPRVLVLDEPSTALSRPDIDRLFAMVRRVLANETAVLLVSHSIDEVLRECDTVTVLRDGSVVASAPSASVTREALVELIVGRPLDASRRSARRKAADVVLRVEELQGETVRDLSFAVGRGEIVGFAGVVDSGRSEVMYLLGGARPRLGGRVTLEVDHLENLSPIEAKAHGIAFVASDRQRESAIPSMRARDNVTLGRAINGGRLGWISDSSERTEAARWMGTVGVTPLDPDRLMTLFSGGNQQKIVLARVFRQAPRLLVIDQPLQGVDIGAKASLCRQLRAGAADGLSILVASSDAEDLVALCDRVIVLHRGRIGAELIGSEISVDAINHHSLLVSEAANLGAGLG